MRAISTVLDVSLCLLLVSASAVTLAGTPAGEKRPERAVAPEEADRTAALLATSTASVTYRSPSSFSPPASAERSAASAAKHRNRTVHDTLAGLLASAVRAKASRNATAFLRAVTTRVGRTLRRADIRARVVARPAFASSSTPTDRPARVAAGPAPPPDADVSAAAFAVRGVTVSVRTWSR
ncbi:DUF7284 family protein [Halorussus salinus]|uniref:DUF7284 family protein n=1 Tax=Halorussus salinus TaxID=1364935 RepID=UPI001092ED05|nr:hypothetical protein [Halorussus salinus]